LAQVLSNLLNNAAKYMDEGGHIWLSAGREDQQIVFRVKDTGVGIAADKMPLIFDMFVQADDSLERSRSGLGIGLTLVRWLVNLHGGTIQVFSEGPGTGSEFVVRLPIVEPVAATSLPLESERPRNIPANSIRILVVDDNKDAANGLAKLLRLAGHTVSVAHDGLAALGAAATFQPDIAILDIGLPKLSGYDVAQRIRRDRGNDVVLIALTGWGQEADRQRSQDAGFDYHVTKPIEFAVLTRLLASLTMRKA
jgi:CheY-like chemotaxis protein